MDAQIDRTVDIAHFAGSLFASTGAEAASKLFRHALRPFGYDTFACGETDIRDIRRSTFYVIDWPTGFASSYLADAYLPHCPLMHALKDATCALDWGQIKPMRELHESAEPLIMAANKHGWDDGLLVPVGRGGYRRGMIHLMGNSSRIRPEERSHVIAISILFHEHVRGQLAGSAALVDCSKLTLREKECLHHVAAGLPDAAIANRMETTQTDINMMVHNARFKLGAGTRAEAVAIVVSLGLVVI